MSQGRPEKSHLVRCWIFRQGYQPELFLSLSTDFSIRACVMTQCNGKGSFIVTYESEGLFDNEYRTEKHIFVIYSQSFDYVKEIITCKLIQVTKPTQIIRFQPSNKFHFKSAINCQDIELII